MRISCRPELRYYVAGLIIKHPWMRISWVCPECSDLHVDVGVLDSFDEESISMRLYEKNGKSDGEMGWIMKNIYSIEFGARFLTKFGNYIEQSKS